MKNHTQKITFSALFAALICVATMIIKIPTPVTSGYIHPGDAFVILAGIFLGPLYGALAAGIGSALADLFGGYFLYVPITFFVKAIIAAVVYYIYYIGARKITKTHTKCILCGIAATIIVAVGYLAFELIIYGPAAVASVPANIVQGIGGLVISSLLVPFFSKTFKFLEHDN